MTMGLNGRRGADALYVSLLMKNGGAGSGPGELKVNFQKRRT
jgi:hypothetical protein